MEAKGPLTPAPTQPHTTPTAMKIYAVFSGTYSDRELVAVFSSLEAANNYQQYLDNENEPEEFELDSINTPDWWDTKKKAFDCFATILRLASGGFSFGPIQCTEYSPGQYGATLKDFGKTRFEIKRLREYQFGVFSAYRQIGQIGVKVFSGDKDEAIHKASEYFNRWVHDNQHIFQE